MSNHIGTVDLTPTQSNKEAAVNSNFGRMDGKLADNVVITADDSTSTYTMLTASWQTHFAIIFENDVGDPCDASSSVTLATTNRTIGMFMVINQLPCDVIHDGFAVPPATSQIFYYDGTSLTQMGIGAALNVYKEAVRIAHGVNVTIATGLNNGDSLDGETLVTGDRVLLYDQTAPEDNGVWVVGPSPIRATDMDATGEIIPGTGFKVLDGSHAGSLFFCDNATIPTIGVDAITFTEFSGGGGGSSTFIGLTDVPADFTSDALKLVRVNAGETALEFIAPVSTLLGDMPASLTALRAFRVNAAGTAYEQIIDTKVGSGSFGGAPTATQVVFAWQLPYDASFPTNLAGSAIHALVAATASADFDILLDGVSVGTANFAIAADDATFTVTTFTATKGQILTITGPGTPDGTLADLFFTILFNRNS